jgi:SAM-dependent methyltransferase
LRAKRASERSATAAATKPKAKAKAVTLIEVEPEPVDTSVRLNLGAGQFRVKGWLSIDSVPELKPDLVEDVITLPNFQADTVDSIYAGHVIEHLADPVAALLRWYEILKPGGDLTVSCPDHAKAVELWSKAERFPVLTEQPLVGLLAVTTGFYSFRQYQEMKAVNPAAAAAQQHRRSLDLPVLFALMQASGFVELEQIDELQHPCAPKFAETVTWQMMVRGRKAENG